MWTSRFIRYEILRWRFLALLQLAELDNFHDIWKRNFNKIFVLTRLHFNKDFPLLQCVWRQNSKINDRYTSILKEHDFYFQ